MVTVIPASFSIPAAMLAYVHRKITGSADHAGLLANRIDELT
jgi:hypothetical protein